MGSKMDFIVDSAVAVIAIVIGKVELGCFSDLG